MVCKHRLQNIFWKGFVFFESSLTFQLNVQKKDVWSDLVKFNNRTYIANRQLCNISYALPPFYLRCIYEVNNKFNNEKLETTLKEQEKRGRGKKKKNKYLVTRRIITSGEISCQFPLSVRATCGISKQHATQLTIISVLVKRKALLDFHKCS